MLNRIRIVLVSPSHPGNIGATARAMKNMGLTRLVLVSPRRFPHADAVYRAASAGDVLADAKVVDCLDDAIADCHLVVGTSARERRIDWPLYSAREAVDKVFQQMTAELANTKAQCAIVFGREKYYNGG